MPGAGFSPTELSISTSPASLRAARLVDIGQRIQHAERPADDHDLARQAGQKLADIRPPPVLVVAGGVISESPWPRGSNSTT